MSLSKINLFVFSCTLFLSVFIQVQSAKAQRYIDPEENPPLVDRLYFGGNFAAQFGTITFIDVSPLVGAMITDKFSGGVGVTYQYFDDRRFINASGNRSLYGGRTFLRYNVLPNIFAHTEYEALNFDLFNRNTNEFNREWVPSFFVGAGYFTPFGNRGGANFTLLYNLMHDNLRSPYNEPYVIRVGFVF
ncbi:hypothetical protein ACFOUP_05130 [Belliella kenyensis]|uniref:Outer membrane protein beta-barrel domain-containing protein n=1 Tax=Belliella kenyensis TaxID=1472724 RepID=A0ABV8EHK0_9BACT|nr:hypothetical protein [Belliella kenyensis]MCH7402677.1 hypothetical protein [Belliella kenyensis]MDN3603775.1 hypothetical protein [Belliella kenyensis]